MFHVSVAEPSAEASSKGAFPPESIIRRVSGEAVGLLGGGRALLMQLAHPLIAAGVAEHSAFESAPLARLQRTVDLVHTLVFGARHEVEAALGAFHRGHSKIHGRLGEPVGRYAAGDSYTAGDAALRLWVWATLVDSQRTVYEHFVAPLERDERRLLAADGRRLGELMGVPAHLSPAGPEAFDDYMAGMLAGNHLAITDGVRQMSRLLLDPPVALLPRACAWLVRSVTPGLLPERLRGDYGMTWTSGQQRWLDGLGWTSRRALPVLPAWLRYLGPPGGDSFVRRVMR